METAVTTAHLVFLVSLAPTHQSHWTLRANAAGAHPDLLAHPARPALLVPLETRDSLAKVDNLANKAHLDLPDLLATLATKPQTANPDRKVNLATTRPLAKKATMDHLAPEENLDHLDPQASAVNKPNKAHLANLHLLVLLDNPASLATKDRPDNLDQKVDLVWMPSIVLALAAAIKHLERWWISRGLHQKKFTACSSCFSFE